MKSTMAAVLVAGTLLYSAADVSLAAGKLGGASGMDAFVLALSQDDQADIGDANGDHFVRMGGKVGGSMDRLARLGGKLGVGTGDD